VTQRDDILALRMDLREQHRGFVGFRAAVGEKRFLQSSGGDLGEFLRQPNLRLVGVKRRHMLQLVGLVVDGLDDFVIAMTDTDRQDTAEEIQELVSFGVVDIVVLGVVHDQRLVVIRGYAREEILFLFVDDFLLFHVSL
jgi:hypothetical protein